MASSLPYSSARSDHNEWENAMSARLGRKGHGRGERAERAEARKRSEGAMGPNSINLAELLARTGDGALAMRPDGRIVFWNDAATALLGHQRSDVIGRPCWEVLAGQDAYGRVLCCETCAVLRDARAGDAIVPFEMRVPAKVGCPVDLSVSTLSGHSPDLARLVIVHLLRGRPKAADGAAASGARPASAGTSEAAGVDEAGAPSLTRRELEVLALTRDGEATLSIARRLRITRATVRNHTQSILRKLDAHSRLEAVAVGTRRGLLL